MANTTPSTPNTTESGHPGNTMTHTGTDAHEGSTVTSTEGEHSHLHFDDGYKLHFGEIASLFEDIVLESCIHKKKNLNFVKRILNYYFQMKRLLSFLR